jgi:hypothetical protein
MREVNDMKFFRYVPAAILVTLLLSGCATDPAAEQAQAQKLMEYKIRVYGPACEKLGYAKETDGWRECIQREYEQSVLRRQIQMNTPPWNPYGPSYYRPCYQFKGGWRCR